MKTEDSLFAPKKLVSLALVVSILFSLTACGAKGNNTSSGLNQSIYNDQYLEDEILVDTVLEDTIISDTLVEEFITEDIYLNDIILADEKITDIILSDEIISDVIYCKSIYVPQNNLEEFAKNSQTIQLFSDPVELTSLLTKISVGTGVIVTVAILKVAGVTNPVASVVAAAADESLKFASTGAAIGSLFGGMTGATDSFDESGRMTSIIGFATATAGLILTITSLVATIPSAGTTAPTAAIGVKLVIAGISIMTATAGTAYAGYQAVKTFTSTESSKIDWKNINWKKVGVNSAEKAIKNAADGYMWGAIIGTVYGGAEEYYQKFNTPYTKYNDRLNQTPKNNQGGIWTGERGNSEFILDKPIQLPDGSKVISATYKNAVPDLEPYQVAQVKIPRMTNNRYGRGGNFEQADQALSELWTKTKYNDQTWTAREVEMYRKSHNLTWHEMSNMEKMQLIPREVNQVFTHYGGVAEFNAMKGTKGALEFD